MPKKPSVSNFRLSRLSTSSTKITIGAVICASRILSMNSSKRFTGLKACTLLSFHQLLKGTASARPRSSISRLSVPAYHCSSVGVVPRDWGSITAHTTPSCRSRCIVRTLRLDLPICRQLNTKQVSPALRRS